MNKLLHIFGIHNWSGWYLNKVEAWLDIDNYIDTKKRDIWAPSGYEMIRKCEICGKLDTMIVHKN